MLSPHDTARDGSYSGIGSGGGGAVDILGGAAEGGTSLSTAPEPGPPAAGTAMLLLG
jgi:hypothetical protein